MKKISGSLYTHTATGLVVRSRRQKVAIDSFAKEDVHKVEKKPDRCGIGMRFKHTKKNLHRSKYITSKVYEQHLQLR